MNTPVKRFAAITATAFTLVFGGGVALTQLHTPAVALASAPATAAVAPAPQVDPVVQTLLQEREAARQQLLLANSRIQQAAQELQTLRQENTQLRSVIDQQAASLKQAAKQPVPAGTAAPAQGQPAAPAAPTTPVRHSDDNGD